MPRHQRVLLSSVDSLTFYADESTAHRRTLAVPQLSCKGAPCKLFRPDVIQCYNRGGSGTDVQWKCEADLPSSLTLGRVEVGCEGWDHSEDPYILKGSCGLTYTLKRVSSGLDADDFSLAGTLFWVLFAAVALFILYPFIRSFLASFHSIFRHLPDSNNNRPGGGGGGGNDPPPPYTRGAPPSNKASSPSGDASGSAWRPGFWTGAAAGAAITHLFGGGGRSRQADPYLGYRQGWDFDRSPFMGAQRAGGGWFGGGIGGRPGRDDLGEGSSRGLGPIRSSTGFGGTRNR